VLQKHVLGHCRQASAQERGNVGCQVSVELRVRKVACFISFADPSSKAPLNTGAKNGQEVLPALAAVASRAEGEAAVARRARGEAASQQQQQVQVQQRRHDQSLQQEVQQEHRQTQEKHRPQPYRQPVEQAEQLSARREPSAAERRQLLAEAALRRLEMHLPVDPLAPQQQQQQHQLVLDFPLRDREDGSEAQPLESPALLLPPQQDLEQQQEAQRELQQRGFSDVQIGKQQQQQGRQQEVQWEQQFSVDEDVVDLTGSQPESQPPTIASMHPEGSAPDKLQCPICGRCWSGAELSNSELNAHIDVCLARKP